MIHCPRPSLSIQHKRSGDEVERLLAALEKASKGQRPIVSRVFLGCLSVLSTIILYLIASISWDTLASPVAVTLFVIGMAYVFSLKFSTSGEQKRIALQLLRRYDKRIIGALILAHRWPDMEEYQGGFRRALIVLLPQL
jgi:hypothetical protein